MPWPVWLWWDWPLWFTCCRQWGLYGTYVCTWWPRSKQATDPYYRHKYEQTTILKVNWSNDVGFKSCMLIIIVCLTVVRHSLKTYFHALKITRFQFFCFMWQCGKKKANFFFSTSHEHGVSLVPPTRGVGGIAIVSAICRLPACQSTRLPQWSKSPNIPSIAWQYGVFGHIEIILQSSHMYHRNEKPTNVIYCVKIAVTSQGAIRRQRQLDCLFSLFIA